MFVDALHNTPVGSEHASAVQSGETPEKSVFVLAQYGHVLLPND